MIKSWCCYRRVSSGVPPPTPRYIADPTQASSVFPTANRIPWIDARRLYHPLGHCAAALRCAPPFRTPDFLRAGALVAASTPRHWRAHDQLGSLSRQRFTGRARAHNPLNGIFIPARGSEECHLGLMRHWSILIRWPLRPSSTLRCVIHDYLQLQLARLSSTRSNFRLDAISVGATKPHGTALAVRSVQPGPPPRGKLQPQTIPICALLLILLSAFPSVQSILSQRICHVSRHATTPISNTFP